ncbi:hypothetical protein [Ferrovibrio sp.]|uniref:hypothetical protein n=1 Tax=Ferrovibrio sp. TaxID=1917215 RepID=UPI0025C58CF6|nr:hypothetical protein [Ferrovibrio sp.]
MPIFARRRLYRMLDDLTAHADQTKIGELRRHLDSENTDATLSAEAEISLLWAISNVARLEVGPEIAATGRRPDAYSENLFPSSAAIIEIRALSEHSFSGREAMAHRRKGVSVWLTIRRSGLQPNKQK